MKTRAYRNRFRLAAGVLLAAFSQAIFALGLGDAQVRSFLGQPLDVSVRLISRSQDELDTVTARLATADDYALMGVSGAALSVPLSFAVTGAFPDAYVRVTSAIPVNDPVMQLVLEVSFAGGRMLREYTLFLDPSTFAAPVPAPVITPRQAPQAPVASPRPAGAEPVLSTPVETVTLADPEQEPSLTTTPGPESADEWLTPVVSVESGPETQTITAGEESADFPALKETFPPYDAAPDDAEPQAAPEPAREIAGTEFKEPPAYQQVADSGETYGPVRRGDTLWRIASRLARGTPYSVNQMMLALQRLNPHGFISNNINALKAGVVLRVPTYQQVAAISRRDAMLEAVRQERLYRTRRAGERLPDVPDLIAVAPEEPAEQPDLTEAQDETLLAAPSGRLELVPPEGVETAEAYPGGADAGGGSNSSASMAAARYAEEAANLEQEKEYLAEQLREFEAQAASGNAEGGIADSGLAELEDALREDRLSGEAEKPVTVVPPRDDEARYSGTAWWIAGSAVLLVAALVWALRRFRGGGVGGEDTPAADAEQVNGDRGEQQPRVPESGRELAEDAAGTEDSSEPRREPPGHGATKLETPAAGRAAARDTGEEAVELDAEDPVTKLDLARAYIAMNKNDVARALLEEVLEHGGEDQVEAARRLLDGI